jgi:sphingomyelin phosphodiesterase
MLISSLTCAAVLLGSSMVHATINSTAQALNTTNSNLIPNAGGPSLYYNGSGDVPSYYEVSPVPVAVTPLQGFV